jgi:hypothetical protein
MKLAPLVAAAIVAPHTAHAFCGFYVAPGDQKMFNDATQVVLMRSGTRTVLAMQNNYKGPPDAFAMVVPVPVVLHDGDVKTLPREVFDHVEQMGAPRLVEYWEQDPCPAPPAAPGHADAAAASVPDLALPAVQQTPRDLGVTVEARFTVAEYQIVILSAKDSTGLDAWLQREHYAIPPAAEPLLRPYVEAGSKWFVAKVDPAKVKFVDGRAALSPLRFHYDADEFSRPIRLGLANSSGTQDLIVNILAPQQRYEVANGKNVTIPTNLDLSSQMKDRFAAFYTALFDRTLEKNPGAIVTEYAWQATTCDPCPGPVLDPSELMTLGADVLGGSRDKPGPYPGADFVLTRLHARYGKTVTDDLRFKEAPPIVGGRESVSANGKLEEGARPDSYNNFQARYAIRYPWTGPITCSKPVRNVWGGPPPELAGKIEYAAARAATNLAFAPRSEVTLAAAVLQDVPEIDLRTGASKPPAPVGSSPGSGVAANGKKRAGCGCGTGDRNDGLLGALLVGASMLFARRRRPRGA